MSPSLHADFLSAVQKTALPAWDFRGAGLGGTAAPAAGRRLSSNLVLCHLNHSLRGTASGRMRPWCAGLPKNTHLLRNGRVNVPELMLKMESPWSWRPAMPGTSSLLDCARKYRCNRILIAHHADDQAETILFNLLRGSYGLKGMHFCTVHQVNGKELHCCARCSSHPRGHQ